VMGVSAPGREPPRPPVQRPASKAERAATERGDFDFGI
jgi:hypothetical protein